MGVQLYVLCAGAPAVIQRLKIDVQARRAAIPSDAWSDAVEAAIRVVEQGRDLAARHRGIIDAAIAGDAAGRPGPVGRDLTELRALVDARQRGDTVFPPTCTREQLLAVACPTCGVPAGAYCELRPGKILLLSQHCAERFWAAQGTAGAVN